MQQTYGTIRRSAEASPKRWNKPSFLDRGVRAIPLLIPLILVGWIFNRLSNDFQPSTNYLQDKISLKQSQHKIYNESSKFSNFFEHINAKIDHKQNPCNDFYAYACGSWISKKNSSAHTAYELNSFTFAQNEANRVLDKILEENPPTLSHFYRACLNIENIDVKAVKFVGELLTVVDNAASKDEVIRLAGEYDQRFGLNSFVSIEVLPNPQQSSKYVFSLTQSGLTYPSKKYYTESVHSSYYKSLLRKYIDGIARMNSFNFTDSFEDVWNMEVAFAGYFIPDNELRIAQKTNTIYTHHEMVTLAPFLDTYLQGMESLEVFPIKKLVISTPAFFQAQQSILNEASLSALKSYLKFHVVNFFVDLLGDSYRKTSEEFHMTLYGAKGIASKQEFCQQMTSTFLGFLLGEYYMEEVLSPEDKKRAKQLLNEIELSMKAVLKETEWLDKITYKNAVEKLKNMLNQVGGGPKLSGSIQLEGPFSLMALEILKASSYAEIKSIGKKVDRRRYYMLPQIVNAYYVPPLNRMVFNAAILQRPFYSEKGYPEVTNYARIGSIMGHELTHSVDDQGRLYDAKGNLHDWWSPTSAKQYEERAKCLEQQYSTFPVDSNDGHVLGYLDGKLTLGENIADNGGLHLAYKAYQAAKTNGKDVANQFFFGEKKFDENQIFFLSYAQEWCEWRTDELSTYSLSKDPHSSGKWRVNGPLMNSNAFAASFKCPANASMNPVNKCVVW